MQKVISTAKEFNDEIPENFKCVICHKLVYKPVLCEKCCAMNHAECLQEWNKTSKKCPKDC